MSRRLHRRHFLGHVAAGAAGFWVAGRAAGQDSKSPNDRLRFACIGVGGKGRSDSADAARAGDVVAICDVDEDFLGQAQKLYPKAKAYTDYRRLFDETHKSLDAVTVSTPDHHHAPATAAAMRLGKGCFTQKPLTHSLWEARRLAEIARETKVATQMGNQGTAGAGLREAAALVQAGALGLVKEVHVWTNRPIWPQGKDRPKESEPVPTSLHWDLWLGPAKERPYHHGPVNARNPKRGTYCNFSWRGWWDFGTGALGDMACHTMNLPFMALDLREPTSVEAHSSGHNKEMYPSWSVITYAFPPRDKRPGLTMTWYDGGKTPPESVLKGLKIATSGALIVGDKGRLYSGSDYGATFQLLDGLEKKPVEFVKSPGHFAEFARAVKGGEARSNFADYAGPLTETVLLGNLAVWAGKKVEWDAKNLRATNAPEVEELIRPHYRPGWSL